MVLAQPCPALSRSFLVYFTYGNVIIPSAQLNKIALTPSSRRRLDSKLVRAFCVLSKTSFLLSLPSRRVADFQLAGSSFESLQKEFNTNCQSLEQFNIFLSHFTISLPHLV